MRKKIYKFDLHDVLFGGNGSEAYNRAIIGEGTPFLAPAEAAAATHELDHHALAWTPTLAPVEAAAATYELDQHALAWTPTLAPAEAAAATHEHDQHALTWTPTLAPAEAATASEPKDPKGESEEEFNREEKAEKEGKSTDKDLPSTPAPGSTSMTRGTSESKETKAAAQPIAQQATINEQKGKTAETYKASTITEPKSAAATTSEVASATLVKSNGGEKNKSNQIKNLTSTGYVCNKFDFKPTTLYALSSPSTVTSSTEQKASSSVSVSRSFLRELFIDKVKLKIEENRKVHGEINEAIIVDYKFIERCVTGVLAADKMLYKNHYQNLFDDASRKDFIKECTKEIEKSLSNKKLAGISR
jgi:hypothetical protein